MGTSKILHYLVAAVLKIRREGKEKENFNQYIGMRVVLGNLLPRTNELNRCNAREGCAYGTIWAAPLTVANVNRFPYSVAQPPTCIQNISPITQWVCLVVGVCNVLNRKSFLVNSVADFYWICLFGPFHVLSPCQVEKNTSILLDMDNHLAFVKPSSVRRSNFKL